MNTNKFYRDVRLRYRQKLAALDEESPGFLQGVGDGFSNWGDAIVNGFGSAISGIVSPFSRDIAKTYGKFVDRGAYNGADLFGLQSNPNADMTYRIGRGVGSVAGALPGANLISALKSLITGSFENPGLIGQENTQGV